MIKSPIRRLEETSDAERLKWLMRGIRYNGRIIMPWKDDYWVGMNPYQTIDDAKKAIDQSYIHLQKSIKL